MIYKNASFKSGDYVIVKKDIEYFIGFFFKIVQYIFSYLKKQK